MTLAAKGSVWSGVFAHKGTSSLSEGWIGSIRQWRPSRETLAHGTTTPKEVLS